MKDAFSRASVAFGIMKDALFDPIGAEEIRNVLVLVRRQRNDARHSGAVQHQRALWKTGHGSLLEVVEEEGLDPLVGGAEMIAEQALFLAVLSDERGDDVVEIRLRTRGYRATTEEGELYIDVRNQTRHPVMTIQYGVLRRTGNGRLHSSTQGSGHIPGTK